MACYTGAMPPLLHFSGASQPKRKAVKAAPAGWAESLDRSEAQLARGETLPIEPTLDRLRATIARMETKRASKK